MKSSKFVKLLLLLLSATPLTSCDWIHYAFMNSIPMKGNVESNPVVRVYLGIDGLSHRTVQEAMKRGIFDEPSWKIAPFISMFPATSDASWTRVMRSEPLGGYEFEYYDPTQDKIINKGILGVVKHVTPAFSKAPAGTPKYLLGFDHWANGYSHGFVAYANTYTGVAESLDNLFFLLEGRAETKSAFSAYLLELDVLGHMKSEDDVISALGMLHRRIKKFKRAHPERKFLFTIMSDRGMDFTPPGGGSFVRMDDEMRNVGITPVTSLAGRDSSHEIFAIPIIHTRVSYLAIHTLPALIEEVALRTSRIAAVDVTVARLKNPIQNPSAPRSLQWFGIWSNGSLIAYFGFDQVTDEYYLPSDADYARLGLNLNFSSGETFKVLTDEALFEISKDTTYPDLFYRIRTGLMPGGVQYPGDIIVSFKTGWASMGFTMPGGANEIANAGFHGALDAPSSNGVLLTDERSLPSAVRSDTFMDLFPFMKSNIEGLGSSVHLHDPHSSLDY